MLTLYQQSTEHCTPTLPLVLTTIPRLQMRTLRLCRIGDLSKGTQLVIEEPQATVAPILGYLSASVDCPNGSDDDNIPACEVVSIK